MYNVLNIKILQQEDLYEEQLKKAPYLINKRINNYKKD